MEWPLNATERRTLCAALDRIVPADDYPSATGLGCDEFVRRRLTEATELIDLFRSGLALLDQRAGKAGFWAICADEQDEILLELENHPFVRLLVEQCIEGYYSDPGNGGNRDRLAWDMVGFRVSD